MYTKVARVDLVEDFILCVIMVNNHSNVKNLQQMGCVVKEKKLQDVNRV